MKIHEILENDAEGTAAVYKSAVTIRAGKDWAIIKPYMKDIAITLAQYKKGNIIWRGVNSHDDVLLVDPTRTERVAANTRNYVNVLQSILPAWKEYPSRTLSLICSSARYTASVYTGGDPHIVLPIGDPVIGIAPTQDWWGSFTCELDVPTINYMLNCMFRAASEVDDATVTRQLSSDPVQMIEDLKFVDYVRRTNGPKLRGELNDIGSYMQPIVDNMMSMPVLTWVEEILDPTDNEFSKTTLSQFSNAHSGYELWSSAPAVMMQQYVLDDLIEKGYM
jgi:hypothetical protein